MPLYFTYRTPFNTLASKYTREISSGSVLKWFQEIWRLDVEEEDLYQFFVAQFGTHFYGLAHLAYSIAEDKVAVPASLTELQVKLREHSYINELKIENEKFLEVLTDDDEFSLAWYIVEKEYAENNPKRFLYLIQEDWRLPLGFNNSKKVEFDFQFKNVIVPQEKREGNLYFLSICNNSGDGPIDYSPTKIEGIRLPDLVEYLVDDRFDHQKLPVELLFYGLKLKEESQALNKPLIDHMERFKKSILKLHQLYHFYIDLEKDQLNLGYPEAKNEFNRAFKELPKRGEELSEISKSSLDKITDFHIQGNEHFIQIAIQADFWEDHPVDWSLKNSNVYDQIFMFDDLWVNENYELAYSMMNYYTKWEL